MRRMFAALEIITTVSRHGIHRRPAHCNHRSHKQRKSVRFFKEILVVVKGERNKCKHGLLASLRKESKQRNSQEEMFPVHLICRNKSIPRHQYGKQEYIENFGRGRTCLQQVNRHTAQERRRRKRSPFILEPLRKRKEEEQ